MKKEGHKPIGKILLSVGSIVILILAAISFLVIPAMVPRSQEQLPAFGSYKGKKIEYTQGSFFAKAVDYYVEQQKENRRNVDDSIYFSIFNQAFRDTVMSLAFSDKVNESGYVVPASLVQRSMLPYFFNSNNVYSAKIFRDTPETRKVEIQKEVENKLTYARYSVDISNLKTSDAEIRFIADMNAAVRSFDAAFFPMAEYPKEEALVFAGNNASLFKKYDLSVITLSTEAEAKKIANQLKNNELVFSDAVDEYSTKQYSEENGTLREKYSYQLKNIIKSEDGFKEVTGLSPDSISDAFETSTGWSVFMCTGVPENADFSDSALADTVYNYMTIYEAGIIEEYFINIAKDFSAQAAVKGFYEAAANFNAQTAEIPAFPVNYGNSQILDSISFGTIPQLTEAQSSEKFLTTAFSLTEKEISEPLVVGKNIAVLQLKRAENTEKIDLQTLQVTYSRYTSKSDTSAVQSFFMTSKHLENNLLSVFFKYFMSN